jgi:Uma2 family endonuclease
MATDSRAAFLDRGLRLGPKDAGRPVSAAGFASSAFEEPWTYERERGRLAVTSPDSKEHDDCSEPIRDHLGAYRLARRRLVQEVVSEAWIRVDGGTDRIADIAVYLVPDRPVPDRPDRVPEIVFEVVSPDRESRRRDYVVKRREYLALGVREYVIVDRMRGRVTVYGGRPGGAARRVLRPGDAYTVGWLPGLVIPVSAIFGEGE